MGRARLSALILARDEQANLPGCLDSLGWVDEVVVVLDVRSKDATHRIARERADRVLTRKFDDFAHQRNAGLALARGDWVFSIDADERVTSGLAAEIRLLLNDRNPPHAGYRVPIRSIILRRPFRASGTQDDRPVRLFRRGKGRWVGAVHETVDLDGSLGQLTGWLDHSTIPDIKTFLRKIDRYTTLEARKLHRDGSRPRSFDLTLRPLWTFLKLWLAKGGFRDGPEGFVFCALSGVSVAVRQWKLRELIRDAAGSSGPSSGALAGAGGGP